MALRAMFKLSLEKVTEIVKNGIYYECWDEYVVDPSLPNACRAVCGHVCDDVISRVHS